MNDTNKTIQDRKPNFRNNNGKLFLVRCFACNTETGKENWLPAVASGVCEWCDWKEETCTYGTIQNVKTSGKQKNNS